MSLVKDIIKNFFIVLFGLLSVAVTILIGVAAILLIILALEINIINGVIVFLLECLLIAITVSWSNRYG